MSSNAPALRTLVSVLLQIALGAAMAAVVVVPPWFRADLCADGWHTGPVIVLGISAATIVPAVLLPRLRLAFLVCALSLAGFAAWVLYIGSALGCE
jgi:hypothetical protein